MDRRRVDDELAFMDNRAPELTPAWSAKGARYDYDSQRYVLRTTSKEVDEATEIFKRAQWRYLQNPNSLPKGKNFNIENAHSWSEVMQMANEAASKYENRGRSLHRLLRKGGVELGKAGDLTMAWVSLLPVGDYTSVVSGGIKLIFTACTHMNDVRTAALDTLEKLPDSLQAGEQYLDLYKSDAELLKAVERLYITLLRTLESILVWLEHKPVVHALKAFAQQGTYESKTRDSIASLKPVSDRVSSQIEFCFQSRVKDILRHTSQLVQQTPLILENTQHTEEQLEDLRDRLDACTSLMLMIHENKSVAEWRKEDVDRRAKEREEDKRRYEEGEKHRILAEQHRYATEQTLLKVQEQLTRAATPVNINVVQIVAPQSIHPSELFSILCPDLNSHSADSENVLSDGAKQQSIESRRGTWLMRQPTFQKWFSSDESQILLVDGQERDNRITALSYLVAVLGQGLHPDPKCAVLTYFCSLHTDTPEGGIQSGSAICIMRSLLGQLLVQTKLSLNTSSVDNHLVSYLRKFDLSALLALFRTLITTCAPTTIFILLDGVSWLETLPQSEVEDIQRMFFAFRTLVKELRSTKAYTRGRGVSTSNVKILLTSPKPSVEFEQYFDEEERYSMPVAPAAIGAGTFFAEHAMVERDLMERY